MRRLTILLAVLALAGVVVGCASAQKAVDSTVAWLDKPVATTQPGQPSAPTHEQVIAKTVDATAPLIPGGVGYVLGGVLAGGLLVLRKLSSSDHGTINDKIDAVAGTVKGIADAVAPPPPLGAALPASH